MVSLSILLEAGNESLLCIVEFVNQDNKDVVFEKLVGLRLERDSSRDVEPLTATLAASLISLPILLIT